MKTDILKSVSFSLNATRRSSNQINGMKFTKSYCWKLCTINKNKYSLGRPLARSFIHLLHARDEYFRMKYIVYGHVLQSCLHMFRCPVIVKLRIALFLPRTHFDWISRFLFDFKMCSGFVHVILNNLCYFKFKWLAVQRLTMFQRRLLRTNFGHICQMPFHFLSTFGSNVKFLSLRITRIATGMEIKRRGSIYQNTQDDEETHHLRGKNRKIVKFNIFPRRIWCKEPKKNALNFFPVLILRDKVTFCHWMAIQTLLLLPNSLENHKKEEPKKWFRHKQNTFHRTTCARFSEWERLCVHRKDIKWAHSSSS